LPCSIHELTWLAEDQIAFAGSNGIEIWDLTAVKQLYNISAFSLLAISPDGRLAAMSEGMGVIAIWDFANGKKLASLKAESIIIRDAAFSPDSRLLATLTDHGSLIIWDMSEFYSAELYTPLKHLVVWTFLFICM
jgi:guanine nucleotide-binding protein subunit beta-2-like 1 protein